MMAAGSKVFPLTFGEPQMLVEDAKRCGSCIIASSNSSGDRFSFAALAAIAARVKAVFLFGVPF